jgi:hypothetical protein
LDQDPRATGVQGQSQFGIGVFGHTDNDSQQGAGVFGEATGHAPGVHGISQAFDAVVGESASPDNAGVTGRNTSQNPNDGATGIYGTCAFPGPPVVPGGITLGHAGKFDGHVQVNGGLTATNFIEVNNSDASAILATTSGQFPSGIGVQGSSNGGVGVFGTGGTHAGQFDGHVQVNGGLDCTGDHHCQGTLTVGGDQNCQGTLTVGGDQNCQGTLNVVKDIVLTNGDFAEEFDLADAADAEPGTVMVLDAEGAVKPSCVPYDRKVAGIISGAGEYRPGIILDKHDSAYPRSALALVGKVYCKVDASYASIEIGDLLTTSPTQGHAMKAVDVMKSFGAVLGKALRPIASGEGLIPVLVALQ